MPKIQNPLTEIEDRLQAADHSVLSTKIKILRKANNAIKHGNGHSFDWLAKNKDILWFEIRDADVDERLEGDVSLIEQVVLVDDAYYAEMKEIFLQSIEALPELNPFKSF